MNIAEVKKLAKQWRELKQLRMDADKEAAVLKKDETALQARIIAILQAPEVNLDGVTVGDRQIGITETEVPVIEDYPRFAKYVMEEGALDLLQLRLSIGAVRERGEVPGLGKVTTHKLSDKKA